MRSILTSVLVVVVTALLWVLFASAPAHALTATWNGEQLTYDSVNYTPAGESKGTESHGIAEGSQLYIAADPSAEQPANVTPGTPRRVLIIYFSPGVDPPTATTANRQGFDYVSSTQVYSNPSTTETIDIDNTTAAQQVPTCSASITMGWLVCSVSELLATAMDTIFGVIAGFMTVQPIQTDTTSDIYVAWNVMRSFANVGFIIVFLIIIYSQLTNYGVSNYGIKRILPRLIVGAILVNLSFVISAIAVDISNVLGYSIQDVFMSIRDGVFQVNTAELTASTINFESVVGYILSGGAIAGALGAGAVSALIATGGTITAAIYLMLPILLGLCLAALLVLIILAARQAVIIIFIIISPIAFVAYLLPNTEKWFEKWRSTFMTLLIFFPAFSVVYGGAQLAGAVIIQNATSIITLILGLAVQVAPLAIAPLVLKFGGSLLGKVSGIINNRNKGIIDRARNAAKLQADFHAARGRAGVNLRGQKKDLKWYNVARRSSRRLEYRKRNLEFKTKNMNLALDNDYHENDKTYKKLHEQDAGLEMDKERISAQNEAHIDKLIQKPGSQLQDTWARNQEAKAYQKEQKANVTKLEENLHAGHAPEGSSVATQAIAQRVLQSSINTSVAESAAARARENLQKQYAEMLKTNEELQRAAGGIDGEQGAQRAFADAINIASRNRRTAIDNIQTIIAYDNFTDDEKLKLIKGESVKNIKGGMEARLAAMSLLKEGSPSVVMNALEQLDFNDPSISEEDRLDLYSEMSDNLKGGAMRPAFMDFGRLANLAQGKKVRLDADGKPVKDADGNTILDDITSAYDKEGMNNIVIEAINGGKFSIDALDGLYTPYVITLKRAVQASNDGTAMPIPDEKRAALKQNLTQLLNPKRQGYGKLTDENKALYKEIQSMLG